MATMKKAQVGAKVKKTFKSNPDSGGVAPFTDKEQRERRKKLGLPTSKSEEKAYYAKMSKEGARSGKTIKKAQGGGSLGMKSVKAGYDKNPNVTRADIISAVKDKAKSGTKIKKAGTHKMPDGSIMKNSAMKSGGSMKKCKYGCK